MLSPFTQWNPIQDNRFIAEQGLNLYVPKKVVPVDMMIGVNSHEGNFLMAPFFPNGEPLVDRRNFTSSVQSLLTLFYVKNDRVAELFTEFYLGPGPYPKGEYINEKLSECLGDWTLGIPTWLAGKSSAGKTVLT